MNHSPGGKSVTGGKGLLRRTTTRTAAAVAAGSLLLAGGGVAWADIIHNSLDNTVDSTAEILPLNVGGANGTTTLSVEPANGDGKNGCNLTGSTTLVLEIKSSNPSVATVSPATVTFGACNDTKQLTLTPVGVGSATVTASQVSNTTSGSFSLGQAAFQVDVAPAAPSNTAPVLGISGVTAGGSYTEGSVPQAMCDVNDHEDGASSFPATLGPITGPDAAGGVGSREASCSYEDAGGLTASSSLTYNITDGTAPAISYTLSPVTPDGDNGWYKSAVALHWIVEEEDSLNTLVTTGCEDQTITDDQVAIDYSCSATSSGGTADPVTVNLKKDGTAPTVGYTDATGTQGNDGWYTSDVEATFTATDTTSGLLTSTRKVTSSGEGAAVEVSSPAFTDFAGNTTAAGATSQTFKIDKTAPEVGYAGDSTAKANASGWYNTDVVATFTATDAVSGLASAAQSVTSTGEGEGVQVLSPAFTDNAGNIAPAGAASATFNIDKTAPTVSFDSVLGASYFGSTPAAPGCTASDTLSGLSGSCVVSGYDSKVGVHELAATATDLAGNTTTVTQSYEVKAWTLKGFYQPVDMNGVLNTVKGGSTVPAKFEVFAGTTELTDPGLVSFAAARIQCTLQYIDDIELTATGSTSLRYDATAGQFIYNWKTPTGAGSCYKLTMTAKDGSSISANFKLK